MKKIDKANWNDVFAFLGVNYAMRETAINFPTSLSAEEKQLKEMFEKLKNIVSGICLME